MVHLDAVREQTAEPVGVAIFGSTQIGSLSLVGVSQTKLTAGGIVLSDELIHLTINTARRCVCNFGIVQITLLSEFLINAHLVLRVHDVEFRIARFQAHCKFARIAYRVLALLASLGGDYNHICHGASTID